MEDAGAPAAKEHAGTPGTAVGQWQRQSGRRSGKGHAARPAPYSPGPPAPSIRPPACSERRRRRRRRLSRGGHGQGEGKGKHPGARARGSRATPPGALSGAGKGPGGGAVGRGPQALGLAGASDSPGAALGSRGWGGGAVPGPSAAAQTGPGRGAARKRGRGGGTRGGPGRLVTPPCPGLAARYGGGANPLTSPPTPGPLRPPPSRPFRDPGPRTPWGPGKERGARGLRPQPLASGGLNRPAPPHFREGAEAGSRNRPFARGRGFPSGAKPRHPQLGLAGDPGRRVIKAVAGGCPGYWGQGGISPAQAGQG